VPCAKVDIVTTTQCTIGCTVLSFSCVVPLARRVRRQRRVGDSSGGRETAAAGGRQQWWMRCWRLWVETGGSRGNGAHKTTTARTQEPHNKCMKRSLCGSYALGWVAHGAGGNCRQGGSEQAMVATVARTKQRQRMRTRTT
jgi:hypothetical protein